MEKSCLKIHYLKIHPEYFEAVLSGDKTFEIRKNDRNFKVGDILVLSEYLPEEERYTLRSVTKKITYITDYAQQQGYVVIAIK